MRWKCNFIVQLINCSPSVPHIYDSNLKKKNSNFQAHQNENLLIGENPFDADHVIFLARTSDTQTTILTILEHLRRSYESRVSTTKNCIAREWCSYGSEKEVDDDHVETTREKVPVIARYEFPSFPPTNCFYRSASNGLETWRSVTRASIYKTQIQNTWHFRPVISYTRCYEKINSTLAYKYVI